LVSDAIITICARSGSERILNKNLLEIQNKSLLEITIMQALDFLDKDSIFLSSDSEKYLEIAKSYGIQAVLRDNILSGSEVNKLEVIKTISSQIDSAYVIDLDVSAPIRDTLDIEEIYNKLKKGTKMVLGAVKLESINPYFNVVEFGESGTLKLVKDGKFNTNQKSPEVYLLNSIIGFERGFLLGVEQLLPCRQADLHLMEDYKMFDIDNLTDYYVIKNIFENIENFRLIRD
jgi:CMP-N,N'-diacetyllegionaminic acid synthase